MKSEKDIEKLFEFAQTPELRLGLQNNIMGSSLKSSDYSIQKPVVYSFIFGIAALLLLTVGLNFVTKAKEAKIFNQTNVEIKIIKNSDYQKKYQLVGLLFLKYHTKKTMKKIDLRAKQKVIEELLKGNNNGV